MKFSFAYKNNASDYCKLSLYGIYTSWAGICNIFFFAAILVLTITQWDTCNIVFHVILVLLCLLIPVFQPVSIFLRARRQAATLSHDTKLEINDNFIAVTVGVKSENVPFSKIRRIIKRPGFVILGMGGHYGYAIPDRAFKPIAKNSGISLGSAKRELCVLLTK